MMSKVEIELITNESNNWAALLINGEFWAEGKPNCETWHTDYLELFEKLGYKISRRTVSDEEMGD